MQPEENKFITLLTPREQRAVDNINVVLNGDGSDPESGPGAWGDCGEVDVPVVLEALARLSLVHAPASDTLLSELEQAYAEAAPVLWGVDVAANDDVLIFEDVNGNGIRPNPYHPICAMEDMGDGKQEAYAVLIKSLVNATPALLARVKTAEANALPATLNDDLTFILGRPNFWCGHYAPALRVLGHQIPTHAEEEQATVIHWLLQFYLADPINWRELVGAELKKAENTVSDQTVKEGQPNV